MSSFKYNNVYIRDFETIAGVEEGKGDILYEHKVDDYYFGEKKIEDAEIKMQNFCLNNIIKRNKLQNNIDVVVGGDLMNQIAITSYNLINLDIPFLGVYNACSTFNESLIIVSNMLESGMIKNGLCITSSHNLNAERQYRYPIEYGSPKKVYSTFTSTGGACAYLTNEVTNIRVDASTIGSVVDYGIKDSSNMGAVMAPGAAKTLHKHLTELSRNLNDYDLIVTGDLGKLGSQLFLKLIKEDYNYIPNNYFDCGEVMYKDGQDTYQGGSGPVVVPLVLFNKIIKEKRFKRILVLATGSLHNPLMINLKKSIPCICHAVSFEVI